MKPSHTAGPWYAKPSAGDNQGLVISEATGATVAVAHDKADAPILAAALYGLEIAEEAYEMLDDEPSPETVDTVRAMLAAFIATATEAV